MTLYNAQANSAGCAALNGSYFVAVFSIAAVPRKTVGYVCSVSGTTITAGSQQDLVTSEMRENTWSSFATALDDSTIATMFAHSVGTQMGAVAATVDKDNKTMSPGSGVQGSIPPVSRGKPTIDNFDNRYFIMAGDDDVKVFEVDGTTITSGARAELEPSAERPGVCATNPTRWLAAYYDAGDSDKGKLQTGYHTNKTVTKDSDVGITEFESDDTDYIWACRMATDYFVIAYREIVGANLTGKVIAGQYLPGKPYNPNIILG